MTVPAMLEDRPVTLPARERFLLTLKTDATRNAYAADLAQFGAFVASGAGRARLVLVKGGPEPDWARVSRPQVAHYLAHLQELKPATAARKWASLRSFFSWLHAAGLIPGNPTLGLPAPKVASREPRTLSDDELAALLGTPARLLGNGRSTEGRVLLLRDAAMLRLLACGVRASEATALRVDDWAEGYVQIGDGVRHVPLNEPTDEAVRHYLAQRRWLVREGRPTPYLLLNFRGEPITRQGCWLIVQDYARSAGLEHVNASVLRNTHAAHLLKSGVSPKDAATVLGIQNEWTLRARG